MTRWATTTLLTLGALVLTGACTTLLGIDKDYVEDPPDAGVDLDTLCDSMDLGEKCKVFEKTCCTEVGFGFDEATCEAAAKLECEKNVAEVRAGTMSYHPENEKPCVAALEVWSKKCELTATEILSFFKDTVACAHVFEGKRKEGAPCDRQAQCEPLSEDGVVLLCAGSGAKNCIRVGVLEEGAPCALDLAVVCGTGLYCLVQDQESSGTCVKAIPLEGACDPTTPTVCGPSAYCDATTLQCGPTKPPGEPCSDLLECQSWSCTDNACGELVTTVNAAQCGG